jgi:hypothetical protein
MGGFGLTPNVLAQSTAKAAMGGGEDEDAQNLK